MPDRRLQKGNCVTALQPSLAYNAAMSFTLTARPLVAVALMSFALLAAACGGGASPSQTNTTTIPPAARGESTAVIYTDKLHYAQCMRTHGIPNYPDPQSNGQFLIQPGENLPSRNSPQFIAADKACQHLLPDGGNTPAEQQQFLAVGLKYSRCMQTHGVPNFPDPRAHGPNGEPCICEGANGPDENSPQFQRAEQACQSIQDQIP
jgi:hypothetical protein